MSHSETPREQEAQQWLTSERIWVAVTAAVLASVAVVAWSVWKGASWESLTDIQVDGTWLGIALACVALRDVGYVLRLWVLSRGELSATRATSSIVLWELASALTPSVVGGSAVASFILHRNGLSWGRSLATVMSTALLDELYFLVAVPVVAVMVGWGAFLPQAAPWLEGSVAAIFGGGYAFMAVLATLLSTALFWAPQAVQGMLHAVLSWRWLQRWKTQGEQLAHDLRHASNDLRTMSLASWAGAVAATIVSWTARFLTLNAVLMAFVVPLHGSGLDQFGVWARQLSMWTVMMISPTPGSSGLAELALPTFMEGVMPVALPVALWAAVVLMWRYLTYHLYVLVGGLLMPFWLTQTSAHDGPSWRNFRRP